MTRTWKKCSKSVITLNSRKNSVRPKYVDYLQEDFVLDNSTNFLKRPKPAITTNPTQYQCCLCYQSKPETKMLFISCRAKGIMEKVTRRERSAVNPICRDCLNHKRLNRDECPCCRSHGLYLVKKRYPKKKKTFKKRQELRLLKQEKEKKRAIRLYAIHMGMDPKRDKRYLYIAEQAINAPLPTGWTKSIKHGKLVFSYASITQCYHPNEDIYLHKYVSLKYGTRCF